MTRRLRVLTLIECIGETGGAERFATNLALHLPADRFEVWMCSTRRTDRAVAERLERAGVRHLSLGRNAKWDVHRLAPLVSLMRSQSFDVLHAHMFGSNLWGSLLGRLCGVPVLIAHEHTWSYEGNPLRKWLDGRVISRLASRFIAVSSLDAERMVSLEGVKADKIVMIPTCHIPRPPTVCSDIRSEIGIDATVPLVAVVSILRPQKALNVLLDAFASVIKRVPDAHLVVAGHGPSLNALQRQASELRLAHRIHFLGRRMDVDAILGTADLAAMSSDFEGTPLVVFECMASRTPLVATAVGGLPEVVEHGQTGLLVPPRDPEALAQALVALLRDPVRRRRMGEAAGERLNAFSLDATVHRFAALYETLAAEAGIVVSDDSIAGSDV